jgi:hypothetical protein
MGRNDSVVWGHLSTRVPKALRRELKLHCVTVGTRGIGNSCGSGFGGGRVALRGLSFALTLPIPERRRCRGIQSPAIPYRVWED